MNILKSYGLPLLILVATLLMINHITKQRGHTIKSVIFTYILTIATSIYFMSDINLKIHSNKQFYTFAIFNISVVMFFMLHVNTRLSDDNIILLTFATWFILQLFLYFEMKGKTKIAM